MSTKIIKENKVMANIGIDPSRKCDLCNEGDVKIVRHHNFYGRICEWCSYEVRDMEIEAARHGE
tara:strand:+ start:127 stop:318 length:192 start_codon:yes stop_codon:yes gene_type:complete